MHVISNKFRFVLFACWIGLILSEGVLASSTLTPIQESETQFLTRIDRAAKNINYRGLYVFQQGSQVQSLRITHLVDKANSWEKLEMLDGKQQEIIRHNDDVSIYLPHTQTVLQQKRVQHDQFPGLLSGDHYEWQNHYRLKRSQAERIAGHACDQIILEPRDKLRYGYRLWADKQTALLLKAQTLNEQGEVLEQVAFSEVKINLPFARQKMMPSWPTQHWRQEKQEIQFQAWTQDGWQFNYLPLGFRKQIELRRTKLPEVGTAYSGQISTHIRQVIFSDGLTALSVFVEPFNEQLHTPDEVLKSSGAAHILARRVESFWVVVVGDAPAETIRKLAAGIDFKPVR